MVDKARILSNARIVVRELTSEPDALPLISACAVAGNGWQENLMEPITRGVKDHGSDGLLQWRLDRLENLQRWPDWNTLPVQCRYFKAECKSHYPTLWRQLTNPGNRTLENLTANICDMYERPSKAGRKLDARISYAKQVLAAHDAEAPAPIEVPPILQPAVNGATSSSLGGVALAVAAYLFVNHGSWPIWAAFGAFLIFGVGDKDAPKTVADDPHQVQPKEDHMDVTIVPKVLQILQALVPLLEKSIERLPKIEKDIAELKGFIEHAPDTHASELLDNVKAQIDRLTAGVQ